VPQHDDDDTAANGFWSCIPHRRRWPLLDFLGMSEEINMILAASAAV
jgi:hypothetical protein